VSADTSTSFVRSVLGVLGTNFGVAALGLVNVLVVSRALGPAGRGDVALLTTITNLTHYAATMGVQEANVNLASADPSLRRPLATNSVLFALVFGVLGAAAVLLLVRLVPAAGGDVDHTLLVLSVATVPALVLGRYLRLLAQADYAFAATNVAWIATPIVGLAANVALAAAGRLTVGLAVGSWLVGNLVSTALMLVVVARRSGFGAPSPALARRSLSFGLRSHAGQLLLLGNYRVDQWLVGAIAGSRQLGLYSVAVAWAEALFYLPQALAWVQRPDLARRAGRAAAERATAVTRVALILTAPLAGGLALLAPVLVTTMFGAEFGDAVTQLRVLAIGAFGVVALKLLGDALTAQGMPLRASAGIAVGFVVMLVGDVLLVPEWGGLGAAVAATISYLAGGTAVALLFARALQAPPRDLLPGRRDLPALWSGARAYLPPRRADGARRPRA
jgi:O-antigen/teichoic acid export membrane protein